MSDIVMADEDSLGDVKISRSNEMLDDIITTVGSFRRLILEPESSKSKPLNHLIPEQNMEYLRLTEINIERRKIKFMEEPTSNIYIDSQSWNTNSSSKDDVIEYYKLSCFHLKIRPIPQILSQLEIVNNYNISLAEFNLRGIKFDSKQIEALDEVFKCLKCDVINFAKCSLEDDLIISICEMVEYYQCAKNLIFAHNSKIKTRGWIHLGRMIRRCCYVESLDIGYCAIDNLSLPMFLRCIRADCCLTILHIEGNGLSGKGILILFAAMKFNTHLKEIYLGRNNLNPEDAVTLGEILKNIANLEVLDIRDNAIQDRGLNFLMNSIDNDVENCHLQSLFLTNNSITDLGIETLLKLLKSNLFLKTLSLSGNCIGNTGVQKLKSSLLINKSLSKLGLRNTRLSCEGAIALAEILAESRSIEVLDVRGNDIRIAGLMALSHAHKVNRFLLNLQIPENIKADQRDRQLIIDVLNDLVNYRTRNQSHRDALRIANSLQFANIVESSSGISSQTFDQRSNSNLEISIALLDTNLKEINNCSQENSNFSDFDFKFKEESVLTANPDELARYQLLGSVENKVSTNSDFNSDIEGGESKLDEDKNNNQIYTKSDKANCTHSCQKNLPDLIGELNMTESNTNRGLIEDPPSSFCENFKFKDKTDFSDSNIFKSSKTNPSILQKDSIYNIDLVSSISLSKDETS